MLQNIKQKREDGFTIIEVLIVLAIAGLIMVVVFLAVPALQRNSRNNALSTDANNTLSAVGEYAGNNGGTPPGAISGFSSGGNTATLTPPTGTTGNSATVKLGGNLTALTLNGTALTATATNAGAAQIVTGTTAKCNASGTGLGGTGTARSYVILYVAESASGNGALRCVGN